jgi:hypothetical protein
MSHEDGVAAKLDIEVNLIDSKSMKRMWYVNTYTIDDLKQW